ncbi:hypothetical protein SAMN05216319_1456 [Duganella sp. CF402]|uniref:hypothetical protein n=1 Tax=unclassified Duganella TaxID=2636909 RepID=UPI0008AB9B00|nr:MULTISPECIES: hypothetical protein [unclassified Duganella]RZT10092.1 hypothetical protein EV582_2170 [Duganella sp. BK701]SEL28787.1 hypothetical protein SAMN05216319_1456 [Duganella sp. CF402]
MPQVSLFRLYSLRAVYLIIALGLALVVWPSVIRHAEPWGLSQGVVKCMLASFSLLCVLGIRYPLQMIPVLLWELTWKVIWLLVVALPAWQSGTMDEAIIGTFIECMVVVIIPLAMPWKYVYSRYIQQPGDRWNGATPKLATHGSQP